MDLSICIVRIQQLSVAWEKSQPEKPAEGRRFGSSTLRKWDMDLDKVGDGEPKPGLMCL
jgi:hypothetical protein